LTDLAKYRLESAKERLISAKLELDSGHVKDSINRSYYSIFHAIRALLAEKHIDFKKHSAVISYYRQHYIKTKIFEEKFSDYIGKAFVLRNNSDYEDFYIVAKADAQTQYEHAKEFYEVVKYYLENDEYNHNLNESETRIAKNRQAFDDLMSLCKEVPADRNNDEELNESRKERFGNDSL